MMRRAALVVALALLALPLAAGAGRAHRAGGTLLAFVSAEDEDRLVVLDVGARPPVVARMAVAHGPHNVAASPKGDLVLVTSPPAGRVTVVDARRLRVLKVLAGFGYPHDVEVAPDGRWAYVTDERRGILVVLSLTALRAVRQLPVGRGAHDLAVSPNGRRVWVTHGPAQRELTVVDTTRPSRAAVAGRVDGRGAPHDIAFSPDGRRVWVTYWSSGQVAAFGARSGRLLGRVQAGTLIHHVAVDPTGDRVWVTDHERGTATILSARDGRTLRTVRVGAGPHHVALLAGRAVVASHDSGTISAFYDESLPHDRIGDVWERSIPVGRGLHGVALVFGP